MVFTIDATAIAAALGVLAGAATAGGIIWARVIRPAQRFMGWLAEFRDDWVGVPDRPGVPGRPGMMVRVASIEEQFRPNGGNSMRDRVDTIESRQIAHDQLHATATMAVALSNGSDGREREPA